MPWDTSMFDPKADVKVGAMTPADTTAWDTSMFDAPVIDKETVEAATAQPVGRPTVAPAAPEETMEEFKGLAEKQAIAAQAGAQLGLSPYVTGGYKPQPQLPTVASELGVQLTPEGREAGQEWLRTEALPAVGAMGALMLAPETGGASLLTAIGWTAGLSGAGAFAGEAAEQLAKKEGLLKTGLKESAPRDVWDIVDRAGKRGIEEAAWSALPDMLLRGMPQGIRALMTKGSKGAVDVEGNIVDEGRFEMNQLMDSYAAKHDLSPDEVVTASDRAQAPLFHMAESVAAHSWFTGGKLGRIRQTQAEATQEVITELAGKYMDPAKGYVNNASSEDAIRNYVELNMDVMNDFGTAGLVHTGFTNAQEQQKSVARSMYKVVHDSMERTTMRPVYKEVELPIVGPDGRPLTTMINTTEEVPAFPVDLRGLKGLVETRAKESLNALDSDAAAAIGFPDEANFIQATNTLIDWKANSRQLKRATTEDAASRKLHLDRMIAELQQATDASVDAAHAAGITTADGGSLLDLKGQADALWKEQVEDFENTYILAIMKAANHKNGAPDKLAGLFMQNEMAAKNIMKIIDDAKVSLKGDDLERVTHAHNAIKGSVIQDIFMPFNKVENKYVPPNVSQVFSKQDELTKLFGEEEYQSLHKLAKSIEYQQSIAGNNTLAFAQYARESGMFASSVKGLMKGDKGVASIAAEFASTLVFAGGMGRVLTSKKMIDYATALSDYNTPVPVKVGIMRHIAHQFENWKAAEEATATPSEKERGALRQGDIDDYKNILRGTR